jgi:hypothetical protein
MSLVTRCLRPKTLTVQKVQELVRGRDTIFYIQRGRVKVVVLSDQGKEAVVGILEPGQFFGDGCLNDESDEKSPVAPMGIRTSLPHQPRLGRMALPNG